MTYKCYFDGSCEPKNPGGNMGMGVYIISEGQEYKNSDHLPPAEENTNNVAEYLACIKVLKLLKNKTNCEFEILGDSKLVISQMSGDWKIKKGNYKEKALEAQKLLEELKKNNNKVVFKWIPREENTVADELSKAHII